MRAIWTHGKQRQRQVTAASSVLYGYHRGFSALDYKQQRQYPNRTAVQQERPWSLPASRSYDLSAAERLCGTHLSKWRRELDQLSSSGRCHDVEKTILHMKSLGISMSSHLSNTYLLQACYASNDSKKALELLLSTHRPRITSSFTRLVLLTCRYVHPVISTPPPVNCRVTWSPR